MLEAAIVPNGEVRLTLDLSELTFIDSSGIHALERLTREAERVVVLRSPTASVRRVFEIVGLDQHSRISIEETPPRFDTRPPAEVH